MRYKRTPPHSPGLMHATDTCYLRSAGIVERRRVTGYPVLFGISHPKRFRKKTKRTTRFAVGLLRAREKNIKLAIATRNARDVYFIFFHSPRDTSITR